jgi:DNA-binding HxlR family transcriptional regulator
MLRTKAQEDTLCKTCPLAKTANLVGDSCVLLIIRDLLSGPKRFSNLEPVSVPAPSRINSKCSKKKTS